MKRLFLLCLFVAVLNLHSQQNLKENFISLRSEGTLPEAFTKNIKKSVRDEIAELKKSKEQDKKLKAIYLAEASYSIERNIKSGNVLFNNEITNYLNQLTDVVLAKDPALRKQ